MATLVRREDLREEWLAVGLGRVEDKGRLRQIGI